MEIKKILSLMSAWIAAVAIGVTMLVVYEVKSSACTETVTATVTRVQSRIKRTKSGNRTRSKTVYRPYFSYEFGGRSYTGMTSEQPSYSHYEKGDRIDIRVDPNKPYRYVVPSDPSKELAAFIFIALGIIGAVTTYMREIRPKTEEKKEEDFYY